MFFLNGGLHLCGFNKVCFYVTINVNPNNDIPFTAISNTTLSSTSGKENVADVALRSETMENFK